MKPMHRLFAGIAPLLLVIAPAFAFVPNPPALENKAYLLVDFDSGKVLAESNPQARVAPASLTKMMTSYLVEQALVTGRMKEPGVARGAAAPAPNPACTCH